MQDLEPPEVPIFSEKSVKNKSVEKDNKISKNIKKSSSKNPDNTAANDNIIMPAFDGLESAPSNLLSGEDAALGTMPDGLVLPQLDDALAENTLSAQQDLAQGKAASEEKGGILKRIFSSFVPKHSENNVPAMPKFNDVPALDDLNTIINNTPLVSQDAPNKPLADSKNLSSPDLNKDAPLFIGVDNTAAISKENPKKDADSQKNTVSLKPNSFDWANTQSVGSPMIRQDDAALKINEEIQGMISSAAEHIEEKSPLTLPSNPLIDIPKVDLPLQQIPNTHAELNNMINPPQILTDNNSIVPQMPQLNSQEHAFFRKLDSDHEKLKGQLIKKVTGKGSFDKAGLLSLLKQYDEKIEHKIEHREIELGQKRNKLEKFHKTLKQKELELKKLHAHLKLLDSDLKEKHSVLRQIITNKVSKELAIRTDKERALLKREIKRTVALNSRLQKKLDIIDADMKKFYIKRDKLLSEEQCKLNNYQQIYEKKLQELKKEKDAFEDQKRSAITLLSKGDEMAREFEKLEDARKIVERSKKAISKDIDLDKELKRALDAAETRLKREKDDLDKMIFSKYIVERLSSIRPESMISDSPAGETLSYDGGKIYALIKDCKKQILAKDIVAAKKTYSGMKHLFETGRFNPAEKAMLYNSIRALYSDIQLAVIDM